MSDDLIKICYQGDTGKSDIRTCYVESILHISLKDVMVTLNRENRKIDEEHISKSMAGMLRAQLSSLEVDEYVLIPAINRTFSDEKEIFVTQPGLYRVLAGDRSPAGKKFQKWLFHEVIPSITKFGIYPPPIHSRGSLLSQMAEMLAQNSRALADAIAKQEELESAVTHVKSEISDVKTEVGGVKERIAVLEAGVGFKFMRTVNERLLELELIFTEQQEIELLSWCENITLSKGREKIRCPSGMRFNAKFELMTIDEAISIVDSSRH